MSYLQPYHFARFQAAGFLGFYQRVRRSGGILCFDLEDGIQHPDPERCLLLKREQRRNVVTLLRELAPHLDFAGLGLRINAPGTAAYAEDVQALQLLPRLGYVFVPKVENAAQVQTVHNALPAERLPELIPVVETGRALTT
ncbi:aldolase/citrate lyase family protein [Hymenobacter cellulosilyticus]|uniref:Aldolase/citrate lyase family protein n=1 Tax=Hymenobacter cellulosilyticus TaxID=2932248 RepID=A0A8T9Q8I8_9BACT|nr:aldolase/citrate lyase family protein [Hymenobacter cellulosilyticus]UOQ71333.1 aldolase/citrate lyase family protein [Hymenobacter cellulosilyticus]